MLERIESHLPLICSAEQRDPNWNPDVIAICVALFILIEHKGKLPPLPDGTGKHLANQLVVDLTPKLNRIFAPDDGWQVVQQILGGIDSKMLPGYDAKDIYEPNN